MDDKALYLFIFQSTLPHGERQQVTSAPADETNFNPRSRMGSDTTLITEIRKYPNFNPRSRMGSDGRPAPKTNKNNYFNPRSRMGSDFLCTSWTLRALYFNPRSRMGSDDKRNRIGFSPGPFQSTLPHGERQGSTDRKLHQ